ncbi:hypothetical protein BDQ12DRAFT_618820, partial [Crucibulum laeve]
EEETITLLLQHESQWTHIFDFPTLRWFDFPWPVLSSSPPTYPPELTFENVSAYMLAPFSLSDRVRTREWV